MTGRVIRFKSLVKLIGITGWKFQLLFQMAVVQQEVVELALYGPDAADRVAELPVQITRRFSVPRGLAGDILIRGFTDRAETKLFSALQRNEQRNMRVLGKRLSDRTSACIRFFRRTSELRNKP